MASWVIVSSSFKYASSGLLGENYVVKEYLAMMHQWFSPMYKMC